MMPTHVELSRQRVARKWGHVARRLMNNPPPIPTPTVRVAGREVPFIRSKTTGKPKARPSGIHTGTVVDVGKNIIVLRCNEPDIAEISVPRHLLSNRQAQKLRKGSSISCTLSPQKRMGRYEANGIQSVEL